jgi:hypothetical protein
MPDFPLELVRVNQGRIFTSSPECLGDSHLVAAIGAISAGNTWPTANRAIFLPFEIYQPYTVVKMSITNGATASGNFDIGIYDYKGNRRVSSGSTAQTGTATPQTVDITDTLLLPGLYYMALVFDNTTGTVANWAAGSGSDGQTLANDGLGLFMQDTAFPLPDPATFAAFASTIIPLMSMSDQVTI